MGMVWRGYHYGEARYVEYLRGEGLEMDDRDRGLFRTVKAISKYEGINITEVEVGVDPLDGAFQLEYTNGSLSETRVTPILLHNMNAAELKASLETLDTVGRVTVSRRGCASFAIEAS